MDTSFSGIVRIVLLLFWLLANVEVQAQQGSYRISGQSLVSLRQDTASFYSPLLRSPLLLVYSGRSSSKPAAPPPCLWSLRQATAAAPQIYSYHDLGIFCKLEVQLEKAARLPIKIRLGDVQYVDWLEGKREDSRGF